VTYSYEKSEDFRAQIFLFAGTACCSPLGIFITNLIFFKEEFNLITFGWCLFFFISGYLAINHAYNIMLKKDEINA